MLGGTSLLKMQFYSVHGFNHAKSPELTLSLLLQAEAESTLTLPASRRLPDPDSIKCLRLKLVAAKPGKQY